MPSHRVRVFYRWLELKTGQVAGASNCSMHAPSRSESGILSELVRQQPHLQRYRVVIDRFEWF
jgi:hypothetical protein